MDTAPEFPRPSAGDELIVVVPGGRYRERREILVRVEAIARFQITLEGVDGEELAWDLRKFDVRNRGLWGSYRNGSFGSARNPELHTRETLAYAKRLDRIHVYLQERRVWTRDLGGPLREAVNKDPLGFANVLRRFEGLEEI